MMIEGLEGAWPPQSALYELTQGIFEGEKRNWNGLLF
jgi:hypothetical protein